MDLYLVRHAEAVRVGGTIIRDVDRHLTDDGERDAALMGQALSRIDSEITMVLTSPLVRAVQTGEIIGKQLAAPPIVKSSERLAPGFSQQSLLDELLALSGDSAVVAIGHQPDMTMFIGFLTSATRSAAVAMSTGSIAHVHVDALPAGTESWLRWLLTPEIVQKLLDT